MSSKSCLEQELDKEPKKTPALEQDLDRAKEQKHSLEVIVAEATKLSPGQKKRHKVTFNLENSEDKKVSSASGNVDELKSEEDQLDCSSISPIQDFETFQQDSLKNKTCQNSKLSTNIEMGISKMMLNNSQPEQIYTVFNQEVAVKSNQEMAKDQENKTELTYSLKRSLKQVSPKIDKSRNSSDRSVRSGSENHYEAYGTRKRIRAFENDSLNVSKRNRFNSFYDECEISHNNNHYSRFEDDSHQNIENYNGFSDSKIYRYEHNSFYNSNNYNRKRNREFCGRTDYRRF